MNQTVTVYTSSFCPVCGMVKSFLDSFDITYKEVIVDLNPIARMKVIGKTRKINGSTNQYKWRVDKRV